MSANGFLRDDELTTVQGEIRLENRTARAFFAMQEDARGVGIHLSLVTSYRGAAGYRDWHTQLDMRANPGRYNITPGIVPGLPSNHGWGTCIDVAAGLPWMLKNSTRFGFRRTVANDPNHFEYDGTNPAGDDYIPIPPEEELRHLMSTLPAIFLVADPNGAGLHGTTFCLAEDWAYPYTLADAPAAVAWAAPIFNKPNDGKVYEVSNDTANFLLDSLGINKYEFGAVVQSGGGIGVSRTKAVAAGSASVDLKPVIDAIAGVPAAVRAEIIAPE